MLSLHTGPFARLLAALAVVGLLLGGTVTSVMAMPAGKMASLMAAADQVSSHDQVQHGDFCEHSQKAHNDCADNTDGYQCDTGLDCCPHASSALPMQINVSTGKLIEVQAMTPQWRLSSVTPVTEIRPPISTL